ncbi:hypothetical protein [Paenibacillus wenxiniae]|uniref:DUF1963 domain-containing protein n=1 Tax=Paenibacillus wenxiniae TaxID=1636843 RepID=A0ABW4RGY1_9BACL
MMRENPIHILQHRTDCILYYAQLDMPNESTAGWIGGNAPAYFDNEKHVIDKQEKSSTDEQQKSTTYLFYLSLMHPFKPDHMISIFIPGDYDDYVEHNIYPHCAIQVIEHPVSMESSKDTFTNPDLIKHHIVRGEMIHDSEAMAVPFLIKVGGTPKWIQQEDYYMTELHAESFSFFLQVDEEGYPETLIADDGSYPFGFGALYVYAKIKGSEIGKLVAGFWQFS